MAIHPEPLRSEIQTHAAEFSEVVEFIDDGGLPPCAELDRYRQRIPGDAVATALMAVLTSRSHSGP